MRLSLVASLMLCLAYSALAADQKPHWKQIGETATFSVYEDTNSIKSVPTDGHSYVIEMLSLIDFKPGQLMAGPGVASLDGRSRFDCDKREILDISSNFYQGHMGTGQVVASPNTSKDWVPVQGQLAELAWTTACGIKKSY